MNSRDNKTPTIILTTLAEYQTVFWIDVCRSLKEKRYDAIVLSFDDRSCELMDSVGIINFNIPQLARTILHKVSEQEIADIFLQFNIDNINYWESHERLVFKIYDRYKLDLKFSSYMLAIDDVLSRVLINLDNVVLMQELGGFISVLASLFVARKRSIDNYFLEPAFFKGRLFAIKNTLYAPYIGPVLSVRVSQELRDYIRTAIAGRSIVVPDKDKHHYNRALQKLANIGNAKRLIQKLLDKYIHKKHQEFGHNWIYVGLHVKMLVNEWCLRGKYLSLTDCEPFIYFPFHVPNDMAITLRSPEYLDQLALVDYMVRILPSGINLAVKEHPAMTGAIDSARLTAMLKKYDNLKVIDPSTNNYDVLHKANAVVSINSKSGAEAAMLGKTVFVLGNAFYENSPLVKRIESLKDLPEAIGSVKTRVEEDEIEAYFQTVWEQTSVGELYVNDPVNIENIACTLIDIAGR